MSQHNRIVKFGVFLFSVLCLVSCGEVSSSTGYDGRVFDISKNQDKSLIATSTKVNNNYSLTISGVGESISYEKKELVPWNVISKRITSIEITEGITSIGSYFFIASNLASFVLPSSVTTLEANSFNENVTLFSYGENINNKTKNKIYYYSEEKPSQKGDYFRLVDGVPTIWEDYLFTKTSFLFIGNSFTYRPSSEANPTIPNLFKDVCSNLGIDVDIDYVVKGSHNLTKFANPSDEKGQIVDQKLNTNQYDYIILQEQSTTPINNYNTFNNAVKSLKEKINNTQDKAKIILYETWGSPGGLGSTNYKTVEEMELALRDAYTRSGTLNELDVTYVGQAFSEVYTNHSDIQIYDSSDLRHQSYLGAYLSVMCHVSNIFHVDVRNCTYYGTIQDQTVAKLLQEVAYNTNY